ncbi:MAG: glycosyltransferase [Melioribacteraceae bacterium]|nr:glycosyltransferase [Melioribacteraceae bacterium]
MKILFFLHFYAPEVGAASLRAQYFVKALEDSGHEVKIITPIPNYPAGKHYPGFPNKGIKILKRNGVSYLPIFAPRKQSLMIRGISYISYFITSLFYSLFVNFKYDLIITSSPPMSTAFAAVLVSKIKRKPLIVDIRDLWPDIGIELNIIKNSILIKLLRSIDHFILANSKKLSFHFRVFRERLIKKNSSLNIVEISNGADTSVFETC